MTWALGIYLEESTEQATGNVMIEVPDHTVETLIDQIGNRIHEYNFVDPEDPVIHTHNCGLYGFTEFYFQASCSYREVYISWLTFLCITKQ